MNQTATDRTPQIFLGRYEALRPLGEGGMGRIYLGRQLDNGRQVVIKVMHEHLAADPRFRRTFAHEMRLMMQLRHPHAVALYDACLDETDRPCLVMEFVPGITLDELLKRHGRLEAARAGRLLAQLCQVLQAAHGAGILHRDLTPANMMVVDPDTPGETLKVMDFGLARPVGGPYISLDKLTGTGLGGGTPDYVCPEQVRGEQVDHRGDIYSVGVLLFKLLTGRLPFEEAEEVADILLCHAEKAPPTFAAAGAADVVPPAVEAVVQSCLAKLPADRPQSARELIRNYEEALGQKLLADEPEAPDPSPAPPAADRPPIDPQRLIDSVEAWMPEQIAVVKLRGFVQDQGGEVIDSLPGLVRVRLRGPGEVITHKPRGLRAWLGLGPTVEEVVNWVLMDLHLERQNGGGPSQLLIRVAMRPESNEQLESQREWRPWCEHICRELRGYLIIRR